MSLKFPVSSYNFEHFLIICVSTGMLLSGGKTAGLHISIESVQWHWSGV